MEDPDLQRAKKRKSYEIATFVFAVLFVLDIVLNLGLWGKEIFFWLGVYCLVRWFMLRDKKKAAL